MNPFMLAGSGSIYHWEIELLRLFIIYYFIFQLVFLKRKIFLSFSASVLTTSLYFIVYYLKGNSLGFFYFDFLLEVSLPLVVFIIYCFFAFLIRLLGLQYPITKRTDVYPISLFIPAEETVQKALVKREQGKTYSALFSFISYVIVGVALCYAAALMGTFRYISLYEEYGKSYLFIPWAVLYLPLLYLVYKGYWVAAVGVYVCFLADLSIKGLLYNLKDYQNLLFFVRGFIFIRAGMLLAIICKVERERLIKSQKE